MRDQVVAIIARSMTSTDALLHGFAVMPNHFHLIIRQGLAPLSQLMHAICRRTALAVQRKTGREGHIFERPFRDRACHSADHLRTAIIYTHLNPCRGGLCDDPAEYRWTSHVAYCGARPSDSADPSRFPQVTPCLELFAAHPHGDPEMFRRDYMRHLEWQRLVDRLLEGGVRPLQPPVGHGDAHWQGYFANPAASIGAPAEERKVDLRDLVRTTLREIDPQFSLELLHGRKRGQLAAIRDRIIERALEAGFRGVQIAVVLGVSQSTVSRVATTMRRRPPAHFGTRQGHSGTGPYGMLQSGPPGA